MAAHRASICVPARSTDAEFPVVSAEKNEKCEKKSWKEGVEWSEQSSFGW